MRTWIVSLVAICLLSAFGCGEEPRKKFAGPTSPNNVNNQNDVNNQNNGSPDMGMDQGVVEDDMSPPDNRVDLGPDDDDDDDGVPNAVDNCVLVANPQQLDTDLDSVGDACDNCPSVANVNQVDSDLDSVGDACEEPGYDPRRDRDGDGVIDTEDKCPDDFNSNLSDPDQDSIPNTCDNCPNTPNEPQVDSDGDGVGDACSPQPSGPECPLTLTAGLKPALHIIVDKSGSMSGDFTNSSRVKFDAQIAALTRAAPRLVSEFRLGISSFPGTANIFDPTCNGDEDLSMGSWSTNQVTNSLPGSPGGGSDVVGAMMNIIEENRFDDASDPLSASRPRHVLIFADNDSNGCRPEDEIAAAQQIASQTGATVHAIGLEQSNPEFQGSAATQTGGTFSYVTSETQIDAAITNALDAMVPTDSCTLSLSGPPEDPDRVWILNNGTPLSRSDYTVSGQAVTLTPTACQRVTPSNLDVFAGCAPTCQPATEVCDYEDNNCDGVVDEGCSQCTNEICNGTDDDCDGRIDEGCPA